MPISFRNMPVGSTNTIIYKLYKENRIAIPKSMAGLMLSGILSDTLILTSPTTTDIDKEAVSELFRDISVKIANRPGGYTRILKTGNRLGDNAEMCIIELVDYNENLLGTKEEKKVKTTRRRGTAKKKVSDDTASPKPVKTKTEKEVVATEEVKTEDAPAETETNTAETSEKE